METKEKKVSERKVVLISANENVIDSETIAKIIASDHEDVRIVLNPDDVKKNVVPLAKLYFIELTSAAKETVLTEKGLSVRIIEELRDIKYPALKEEIVKTIAVDDANDELYYLINGEYRLKANGSSERVKLMNHPFTDKDTATTICAGLSRNSLEKVESILRAAEGVRHFLSDQLDKRLY
jgi:hypothetical protein